MRLSRDVENADMSEADGALGVKQPSLIFAYVDSHKLLVKERENKIGLHNCPERARGNSSNPIGNGGVGSWKLMGVAVFNSSISN